jgi:hypothetical protein
VLVLSLRAGSWSRFKSQRLKCVTIIMYDVVNLHLVYRCTPCSPRHCRVEPECNGCSDKDSDNTVQHNYPTDNHYLLFFLPLCFSLPRPIENRHSMAAWHARDYAENTDCQPQTAGSPLLPGHGAPRDHIDCFAISDYRIGITELPPHKHCNLLAQKPWPPRSSARVPWNG